MDSSNLFNFFVSQCPHLQNRSKKKEKIEQDFSQDLIRQYMSSASQGIFSGFVYYGMPLSCLYFYKSWLIGCVCFYFLLYFEYAISLLSGSIVSDELYIRTYIIISLQMLSSFSCCSQKFFFFSLYFNHLSVLYDQMQIFMFILFGVL